MSSMCPFYVKEHKIEGKLLSFSVKDLLLSYECQARKSQPLSEETPLVPTSFSFSFVFTRFVDKT